MSATRRYEVSFRAELDDRGVDDLADTLFEMGYDDLCFRPLPERESMVVKGRPASNPAASSRSESGHHPQPPQDIPSDVAPHTWRKTCAECGEPYWSWGSHAERCTGVRAS